MAQQDRITLKGYLETGDTPTQSEFADLIDSFLNKTDDSDQVLPTPSSGDAGKVTSIKSDESGWESVFQNINGANVKNYGAASGNSASTNETAIQSAIDSDDSNYIVIPKDISYDPDNLTIPDDIAIIDESTGAIYMSGSGIKPDPNNNTHMNVRSLPTNRHTQLYIMPNGEYPTPPFGGGDQYSALKIFFDDYERTITNGELDYRDMGITLNQGGHNNTGIVRINEKNAGNFRGAWQDIQVTWQDGFYSPAKFMLLQPETALTGATDYYQFADNPYWGEGLSYNTNDLVLWNWNVYEAQNSATTGSTPPTHTSGTVSDGGVDWLFIEDVNPLSSGNSFFRPIIFIGDPNKGADGDPAIGFNTVAAHVAEDMLLYDDTKIRFLSTDKNDLEPAIYRNSNNTEIIITGSTADGRNVRIDNLTAQFDVRIRQASGSKTDGATTHNVFNANIIEFNDTSATNFTQFTGAAPDTIITARFRTGNTTLVHSADLKLGGSNITPNAEDVYQFLMIDSNTASIIQ